MTAGTRQWAIEQSGCPGRQLDRWAERGHLKPSRARPDRRRAHRVWPAFEVRVARLMVQLVAAGLTVTAAAKVARRTAAQTDILATATARQAADLEAWSTTDLTSSVRVEVRIA